MRIRTIKPEFWESESLGKVSREARLLFIGLFSSCDDSGRTRAASRLLASRLFPYDGDALKLLPSWLDELEAAGCIRVYVVDGETYLDIPKWLSHQKIDKPSPSKLPEFRPQFARVREGSRKIALEQGTGNREVEQGKDLLAVPAEGEPSLKDEKKTKPPETPPQTPKVRQRNPLFDAIAEVCGVNLAEVNKVIGAEIGTALKAIRESSPTVTIEDIQARARAYHAKFVGAALTPSALAKHWPTLGTASPGAGTKPRDEREAKMIALGLGDLLTS